MASDDIIQQKFNEFVKAEKKIVQSTLDGFDSAPKAPVKAEPPVVKEEQKVPVQEPIAPKAPQAHPTAPVAPAQAPVSNEKVEAPESAKLTDDEKLALMSMRDGALDVELFRKLKADYDKKKLLGEETYERIFEKVEDIPTEDLKHMFENGALRQDKLEAYRANQEERKAESARKGVKKLLEGTGGKTAYNRLVQFSKPGYTTAVGIASAVLGSKLDLKNPTPIKVVDERGQEAEAEVSLTDTGNLRVVFSHFTRVNNKPKFTTKSTVVIPVSRTDQGAKINAELINRNKDYWQNEFLGLVDERHSAIPEYEKIIRTMRENIDNLSAGKIPKFHLK
jgi:hypothetical protein